MNKTKKEESSQKRVGKQILKNVGAATAGSALGYFGAGKLLNKLTKSDLVQNKLKSLSKADRLAARQNLVAAKQLTSGIAGGLSSIALYNAMNKEDEEKTAAFFVNYALRNLV